MPREQRVSSHQFRHDPVRLSSEREITTRQTSIWTAEDDETLMAARAQGMNWQPIANLHFPHKSGNACRKRHERLMEKRNAEDWDGVKLEKLAVEYMAVRKEMWNVLATRLNEKWQNVEAKCMEKGIKNISAAYKSAMRKERGMVTQRHPDPDHQHDSGFGGSDTDAEYELDLAPAMTTTVGESSGYIAHIAPRAPIMHQQPQYNLVPLQPLPSQPMMLGGRTMHPSSHGRNMSIHAMLSPSPPAEEDEE